MKDLKLEHKFTDRGGAEVYIVLRKTPCDACGVPHWTFTGQEIRFELDGNLHIKAVTGIKDRTD